MAFLHCYLHYSTTGLGIQSFKLSIFDLLIFSIFKKDRLGWIRSHRSLKRSTRLNWSRQSLKQIDHDRIDYIDLWKRSTLIKSIMSVFEKDRPWLNQSCQSLKISKSKWSFDHKKRLIRLREKTYFSYVLTDFTPFMPIGINLSIFQS